MKRHHLMRLLLCSLVIRLKRGQILCIVEAMKLMNEIKAEVDGKIVEIAVDNGGTIEYGQTLFLIEKM